jgi:hypothetical protein
VFDSRAERRYNRDKLASNVMFLKIEIFLRNLQKVVDRGVERHYN